MERTRQETDSGLAITASLPRTRPVAISVVVPISERVDRLDEIHRELAAVLESMARPHEIIYVVDGPQAGVLAQLREWQRRETGIQVVLLSRWFGEAAALAVGLDRAHGQTILTFPSYPQIEASELPRLLQAYEQGDSDLLIARRHPRIDSRFNRLQARIFHRLTGWLTGTHYHDVSCGVKVMTRAVAADVDLYGDLHRFFPLLAYQKGFKVEEFPVRQSPHDARRRMHHPGVYLRRLLDMLTLFFIFKFTRKPLRFFGLSGSAVFGAGGLILVYLVIYRFMQFGPIANRPLLILGALLIVLGLQLFSVGLLGEIIVFTHAGGAKDYQVREIREDGRADESDRS